MCVASPGTYVYSYGLGHLQLSPLVHWCSVAAGKGHLVRGTAHIFVGRCAGEPRALGHHMDARLRTVTESQQQSATVRLLGRVSHVAPGHPSGEIRLGGGHTVRVSEYVLWVGGGITAS